jgi:hypothetical protein
LELQNPPDLTHPGTLGCYLNLCCFYAALTGKPPADVPRQLMIWRHLTDAQKEAAREQVDQATFDAYDAALPSWMQRLVVTAGQETIDADVAGYLQRVAWEQYQRARCSW